MRERRPRDVALRDDADRERFWALVDKSDPEGCWPWLGPLTKGYGWYRGRLRAARVALQEALGRRLLPSELALHACDNPPCVRVGAGHVYVGSHADNTRDMYDRGRWKMTPTPSFRAAAAAGARSGWVKRKLDPDWREKHASAMRLGAKNRATR